MSLHSLNSEAETSGLNLTLDPVEKFIFSGLQKQMLRVFGAPAVWVTSTDKVHAIKQFFGQRKVSYPYICIVLQSIAESDDRGNSKASALRGLPAVLANDMRRMYRVQYAQTDFRIGVELVTNSFEDVLKFSNRWMFSRKLGNIKFEVAYGSVSFGVGTMLDQDIQIPIREADPNNVTEYTVSTGMLVHGFMSNATLLEGQIKDTIEVTTSLLETSPEGKKTTSVWKITSSLSQDETGEISTATFPPQQL